MSSPASHLPISAVRGCRALGLILLLGAALPLSKSLWAGAERSADPAQREAPPDWLRALGSPLSAARRVAAARLDERLSADESEAKALAAALAAATPGEAAGEEPAKHLAAQPLAQAPIARAIARAGHADQIRAMLRGLLERDDLVAVWVRRALLVDPGAASALRRLHAQDREAFEDPLAWGLGNEAAAKRLEEFSRMVRRSELEQRFIGRKSPTGTTGYYRGQYDILKAYGDQRLALEFVTSLALDEDLQRPGVFDGGTYRFLEPTHVRFEELRGMAINAVSELCTPEDGDVITRIWARYERLKRRIRSERLRLLRRNLYSRFSPNDDEVEAVGADLGLASDYLTVLYNIDPERFRVELENHLESLSDGTWRAPVKPIAVHGMVPTIQIRVGRFRAAIEHMLRDIEIDPYASLALNYYNIACAYASWSRVAKGRHASWCRSQAERALQMSFKNGWRDVHWMDEDRDLDPIRDGAAYKSLRRAIFRALDLPEDGVLIPRDPDEAGDGDDPQGK